MRYLILIILLFAILLGVAVASRQQPDPASMTQMSHDQRAAETIFVADFDVDRVIGHLGHPLGTVVRVTGVSIDGDSTRMKNDTGKTLLEIHTVNGKAAETKIKFEFLRAHKNVSKPKPGEEFDYYVHEYGAFDGVVELPKELEIDSPNVAHDGFYYRRHITIHQSLK